MSDKIPPEEQTTKAYPPNDDGRNTHHHIHSAWLLVHRRRWTESLRTAPPPALRHSVVAGAQVSLTILVALPFLILSPWSNYIGYAALGSLVGLFGRFAPRHRRPKILLYCALLMVSAILSMSAVTYWGASLWQQLALLCLGCGIFLYINLRGQLGAPGALIFVFAFAPAMAPVDSVEQILGRTAATAGTAFLALFLCWLTDPIRIRSGQDAELPVEPRLSAKHSALMGFRATVGAVLAVSISLYWDAAYPAWAAMGALAVLQGTHLHINMHRALQRTAGTILGALLAWQILMLDPSIWMMLAVLIALQMATETVIGFNYALGQMFVTPMALLLTQMASGSGHAAEMATERVWDTIAGVVIGIAIAWLLSTIDDRRALAAHQEHVMRSS